MRKTSSVEIVPKSQTYRNLLYRTTILTGILSDHLHSRHLGGKSRELLKLHLLRSHLHLFSSP
jgi:hypothetical protein